MFKNEKRQKFVEVCVRNNVYSDKKFKLMFSSKVIKYFPIKPTQRKSVLVIGT